MYFESHWFFAAISSLDKVIGCLLKAIDIKSIWSKSIVVSCFATLLHNCHKVNALDIFYTKPIRCPLFYEKPEYSCHDLLLDFCSCVSMLSWNSMISLWYISLILCSVVVKYQDLSQKCLAKISFTLSIVLVSSCYELYLSVLLQSEVLDCSIETVRWKPLQPLLRTYKTQFSISLDTPVIDYWKRVNFSGKSYTKEDKAARKTATIAWRYSIRFGLLHLCWSIFHIVLYISKYL